MQELSFELWTLEVNRLAKQHLACTWHDLSGDQAPLTEAYDAGTSPYEFVRAWAEQYDLNWRKDETDSDWTCPPAAPDPPRPLHSTPPASSFEAWKAEVQTLCKKHYRLAFGSRLRGSSKDEKENELTLNAAWLMGLSPREFLIQFGQQHRLYWYEDNKPNLELKEGVRP